MLTTAIVASIFAGALVGGWLLWAKFLHWGARWAKLSHVTFRRALVVTMVIKLVVGTPALAFPSVIAFSNGAVALGLSLALLVFCLGVAWLVIRFGLHATMRQSIKAWLPTLIASAAVFAFMEGVVRPFLAESFVASTNSMAPTLLGRHRIATCPRCGCLAYGSAPDWGNLPGELHPMICTKELTLCEVQDPPARVYPRDRMIVLKLLPVRRWDLLAYRFPEAPGENYVHRVVGLPGEELYIDGGYVWVNGKKLEPPEPIRNLRYLHADELDFASGWGDKDAAVQLGPDEYFVLGDFSARARDSRFWSTGAPGHHPYAVPTSHIIGVVTHIYWPPRRWRIIR